MEPQPSSAVQVDAQGRKFLGVQYATCRAYGRLYANAGGTAYVGRCPRCGHPVRVPIGEHGTNQRFFIASCP
jgi:phage FluMu protein Com